MANGVIFGRSRAGISAGNAGIGRAEEAETGALRYLQSIYQDPLQPTPVRMRAAAEALPYENPKLSAMALTSMSANDFAAALDRAIARSGKAPLMIEAQVVEER